MLNELNELNGGTHMDVVPDTTNARRIIAELAAGSRAALKNRGGQRDGRSDPVAPRRDTRGAMSAEVAAAHLFNAAANAALAVIAAGTPSAATLDMLRTAARLTGALAGLTMVDTNNCKGQS